MLKSKLYSALRKPLPLQISLQLLTGKGSLRRELQPQESGDMGSKGPQGWEERVMNVHEDTLAGALALSMQSRTRLSCD